MFFDKKRVLLIVLFMFSSSIFADERLLRSKDAVLEQRKAELDPLGIQLYGFKLLPKFAWETEFKDNIFKSESRRVNDFIEHIQPSFVLKSDWNRHSLKLAVDSDIAFYGQNNDENYQDMTIRLNGQLNVLRDSALNGGFFFSKNHGDRGSPDDTVGRTPTEFFVKGFNVDYKHKFNRFFTQFGIAAQYVDYSNKKTSLGVTINNQDRNNWHYVPSLRLGYEIQREYQAFIELNYSELIYDDQFDDNGLERSSHGYEGLIGVAFDATGLITGEIAIGYKQREINDSSLADTGSLTGRLNLEWNPTPLMTVRGNLLHTFSETTQLGASAVERTSLGIGVEHELLRSLILSLNTGYQHAEYNGFDRANFTEDREENGFLFGVGGRYLVSRYMTVNLSYRFSKRDVNRNGADYEINQIFFNLTGHL